MCRILVAAFVATFLLLPAVSLAEAPSYKFVEGGLIARWSNVIPSPVSHFVIAGYSADYHHKFRDWRLCRSGGQGKFTGANRGYALAIVGMAGRVGVIVVVGQIVDSNRDVTVTGQSLSEMVVERGAGKRCQHREQCRDGEQPHQAAGLVL